VKGRRGRKQAATGWPWGNKEILEIEKWSTRSLSVENWLWKSLWACRKTDYVMMIMMMIAC